MYVCRNVPTEQKIPLYGRLEYLELRFGLLHKLVRIQVQVQVPDLVIEYRTLFFIE